MPLPVHAYEGHIRAPEPRIRCPLACGDTIRVSHSSTFGPARDADGLATSADGATRSRDAAIRSRDVLAKERTGCRGKATGRRRRGKSPRTRGPARDVSDVLAEDRTRSRGKPTGRGHPEKSLERRGPAHDVSRQSGKVAKHCGPIAGSPGQGAGAVFKERRSGEDVARNFRRAADRLTTSADRIGRARDIAA